MNKLMMVAALLVGVLLYTIPAAAQHTDICPVGSLDQVGIAPHDNCNDTTFHNDRQYSPGDTTQTINDISPITQSQSFSQDDFSSGNLDSQSGILNEGDHNILCPAVQQTGDTGNIGNQQGIEPFNTNLDEADLAGNATQTSPSQTGACAPTQNQAATA